MLVVLACGSRGWTSTNIIASALGGLIRDELPKHTVIVHGGARGADTLAGAAARARGMWVASVPVDGVHWNQYGKAAGHMRNEAMLALGVHRVIAFWDGKSPGTRGTMNAAARLGIPGSVYYPDGSHIPWG